MRKILILMGRYLPGYRDGGPLRSIKNLTDRLGEEYEFRILTADRDHGDVCAYPDILRDDWNQVGKAMVWYVSPGGFSKDLITKLAADVNVVYICGCFNDYARTALLLKKQGKIAVKVAVASMGLFSPGALRIKYGKKKLYIAGMKAAGLFRNIQWSATDAEEVEEIRKTIGRKADCRIAQDLPQQIDNIVEPVEKTEEGLRIVFLSRISRKKNLSYAIEILQGVTSKVVFDVYGTLEDEEYYAECQEKARHLPTNIRISYRGEVRPEQVIETLAKYHVFLFPTMGENFGHVIYEAMAAGCIPVISDRAPWKQIEERKLGRVISLEDKRQFTEAIEQLAGIDNEDCLKRQRRASEYARNYGRTVDCQGYRDIFEE